MQEILSKKMLGYLLKTLRVKNGLSQEFVANLLRVSRSNYSQIEIGNQYPTYESLNIIASYYSKTYEWFLLGHGMPLLTEVDREKKVTLKKLEAFGLGEPDVVTYADEISMKEYPLKRKDEKYLQKLPKLSLPGTFKQKGFSYRAFVGAAEPKASVAFFKNDILIGKLINSYFEIFRNELYVVVTTTDVLFIKIEHVDIECMYILGRDERSLEKVKFSITDINEIWEVCGYYSSKMTKTIKNLEGTVHTLENLISQLESEVAGLQLAVSTGKKSG